MAYPLCAARSKRTIKPCSLKSDECGVVQRYGTAMALVTAVAVLAVEQVALPIRAGVAVGFVVAALRIDFTRGLTAKLGLAGRLAIAAAAVLAAYLLLRS